MENYRELVHELCAVNEIELTENLGYLMATIRYEEDDIKTSYCVKRLWSGIEDEENYKKFYNQLQSLLKTLNS